MKQTKNIPTKNIYSLRSVSSRKALVILLVGLTVTLLASRYSYLKLERQAQENYEGVCKDIEFKIAERMKTQVQALRTATAFLESSDTITRKEWSRFMRQSELTENLTGIHAVAYAPILKPQDLKAFEVELAQKEYDGYTVKPGGDRSVYTAILYIEPFTPVNQSVLGYDQYTESNRREAMALARDSDRAVLTGELSLYEALPHNVEAGVIMFLPVYTNGLPLETMEQRRAAIKGWLACPFRMEELMKGILGRWDYLINLEVYKDSISSQTRLFSSRSSKGSLQPLQAQRSHSVLVDFNGSEWYLHFTQTKEQIEAYQGETWLLLATGIIISVLIFILTWALLHTRYRAEQIANELHDSLRDSEEQFKLLSENAMDGITLFEGDAIKYISTGFLQELGYQKEEIENLSMEEVFTYFHPDDVPVYVAKMQEAFRKQVEKYNVTYRMRTARGNYLWYENSVKATYDDTGKHTRSIIQARNITEKVELEQKLKESEERIRSMTQNIPTVLYRCLHDANRRMLFVNPAIEKLSGRAVSEFLGDSDRGLLDLTHPEDRDLVQKTLQEAMEMQQSYQLEYRIVAGSGEEKWVSDTGRGVYDDQGYLQFFDGAMVDITQEKKAEEELQASHILLKNLTQQVPGAIFQYRYHPDGKHYFPYASDNIWDIYGVRPHEVAHDATKILSRVHTDDYATVLQSIIDSYKSLQLWEFEYRVVLEHKGLRWVRGQAVPEKLADDSVLWHGYIHDVTDRREAEEVLKVSQQRWKFALEGSKDGVWDWNLQDDTLYFSPQWKTMLGCEDAGPDSPEAWTRLLHPEDRQKRLYDLQFHIQGHTESYTSMYRVQTPDGSYKWMLDRGMITEKDTQGKALRMIGTYTDLTERMEMEQELNRLNQDKDRFISILAHDLRSPFNALLGYSDLLLHNLAEFDMKTIEKHIQTINIASHQTYELLEQILLWAKSEAGKLSLQPVPFNYTQVCKAVIYTVESRAEKKQISLHLQEHAELEVTADLNVFKTVLRNLLSNAIKFTKPGGDIHISVATMEEGAQFQVCDTGIGMEKEMLQQLWTGAAFSLTTKGTDNEKGTGFGLKLCRELVELHGGRIWAESEVGKGSCFTFFLPHSES